MLIAAYKHQLTRRDWHRLPSMTPRRESVSKAAKQPENVVDRFAEGVDTFGVAISHLRTKPLTPGYGQAER
jgi:hypothetical protein